MSSTDYVSFIVEARPRADACPEHVTVRHWEPVSFERRQQSSAHTRRYHYATRREAEQALERFCGNDCLSTSLATGHVQLGQFNRLYETRIVAVVETPV